jgi:excisionase family DNA binding protein
MAKMIGIAAAADELGVHQQTLRKWVDDGKVPSVRLPSGYRRFTREQLDQIKRDMGITGKLRAAA